MSYTYEFPRPSLTVDAAIFRNYQQKKWILLIERGNEPFKGSWALPGGFVEMEETCEQAVCRELFEETGLKNVELHQFKTYSAVKRDPRGRVVSVVFYGFLQQPDETVIAGDDASKAKWFPIDAIPILAFDHHLVIKEILEKIDVEFP